MKRKTLCAFAMILWLLLFSTFFSLRVEQMMVPDVYTVSPHPIEHKVALDCPFFDEDGAMTIYRVREETGWEEGLRASILPSNQYELGMDGIEVRGADMVIRYSSKLPRAGEIVHPVTPSRNRTDLYLAVGEDPLRATLPETYKVLETQRNARLVSVTKGSDIFLPDQAVQELFETDPFMGPKTQVYSLGELEQFTSALRLLALIFALLLTVAVLWLYSFFLLKDVSKNRKRLIVNGSLSIVFLIAVPILLHILALPSSLLPTQTIVDMGHYQREFSEIFSALQNLSAAGNETASAALSQAQTMLWVSIGILAGGLALGIVIVLAEKLTRKRKKVAPRHAAR